MKFTRLILAFLLCALLAQGAQSPAPKPVVTKEALKQRIANLEVARAQAIANVNALDGAIQEAQYWLGMIEAEEAKAKEPPKTEPPKPETPPAKKE